MKDYILILGFENDAFDVEKQIDQSLKKIRPQIDIISFTGKWELRNWLNDHAEVMMHSKPFRHDSRVFYNDAMFCSKEDYENTFQWHKYHSNKIKCLIMSSCTRELDASRSDIVYDNLEFAKNILPKVPKVILDYTDGRWCTQQEHEFVDLIHEHQQAVYFLNRNTSSKEQTDKSNQQVRQFMVRMVKSNFDLMLETYLSLRP